MSLVVDWRTGHHASYDHVSCGGGELGEMSRSVSVAMCTRNGAAYVAEQVKSIIDQKLLPVEVVVSDDASTDGTVGIIRSLFDGVSPGHPAAGIRLTILENVNPLGVTRNFEQAVRACTGRLIALCDQDDRWHPDRLSRQVGEFVRRPELDVLFTDASLVGAGGTSLGAALFETLRLTPADAVAIHDGDAFTRFIKRNLATGATMMFRRRICCVALPFPEEWIHDEWIAITAAAVGQVDLLKEQLIDYRQHGSNQVGMRRTTLLVKVRRTLEPRGERNERLVRRSQLLVERLTSLGSRVAPETLERARTKARVERFRAALPAARLKRLRSVLAADRRGWYAEYCSRGRLDMVRDILQSHR